MKATRTLLLMTMFLAAVAGCNKEMEAPGPEGDGQKVRLTFTCEYTQAADETKVLLDDSALSWTGEETAMLIFGISGTDNSDNPTIPSVSPGVFSGEITIPSGFTMQNLIGIVVPGDNGANFRGSHGDYPVRIRSYIKNPQTSNGAPDMTNCPFFVPLTESDLTKNDDGSYSLGSLQLYSAADIIKYTVCGAHENQKDDEILKSIAIKGSGILAGSFEYNLSNGGFGTNGSSKTVTVNVSGDNVVGNRTKEEGIVAYQNLLLGGTRTISKVVITTDRATYTKTVSQSFSKKDIKTLKVYRAVLDLSAGFTRDASVKYSTDGGSTWMDELPSESYTTLAVKTISGTVMCRKQLDEIVASVNAQSAPVALDFSAAAYEDEIFPAVFEATETAPNETLKSIVFPSNVNEIPLKAFAWCKKLESVELDGINTIRAKAFLRTGLVNLVVPESVTSMPGYLTFGCCPELTTVFYDSPAPQVGSDGKGGNLHTHFGWVDQTTVAGTTVKVTDESNTPEKPLSVTIGPNCEKMPRNIFKFNRKLTHVKYYGIPAHARYVFTQTPFLETIDLSAIMTPPAGSGEEIALNMGNEVASSTVKRIIVPPASLAAYQNHALWSGIADLGYTITAGENVTPTGPGNIVGKNMLPEVASMIEATTVDGMPMGIAHRGCWFKESDGTFYINENSLEGIRMAKRFGYTGVECDVKYTKDNVMVLMHDSSINRTMRNASDHSKISSTVKVANVTFKELREKYVLASSDPNLRVPIPTLEEFLNECKTQGIIPMLHSALPESYSMAQSILGNKWIAFSGYDNVKKAREVSDCLVLYSSNDDYDIVIARTMAIGGWVGISSMKYQLYDAEYIEVVRNAGIEVQASIFPAPHEQRAFSDDISIQLTDFWWHQTKGLTPSAQSSREYSELASGESWTYSGTQADLQAVVVRLEFEGTLTVTMPGDRTYTFTHETRSSEMLCTRLYKTDPTVVVKASGSDAASFSAEVDVYTL